VNLMVLLPWKYSQNASPGLAPGVVFLARSITACLISEIVSESTRSRMMIAPSVS
jgi:hypothetical protein